jgi:hypothetical protein
MCFQGQGPHAIILNMNVTVFASLMAALVALFGLLFQRNKEERFKRLDVRRKYFELQIEQFYGPLFPLVQSMFLHYQVLYKLANSQEAINALPEEARQKIEAYYEDTYFLPVHDKITQLLSTKLYLIEGEDVPESFFEYLEHALLSKAQRQIYAQLYIGTLHLKGKPWPEEFHKDIKKGFENVMKKYEDATQTIKGG